MPFMCQSICSLSSVPEFRTRAGAEATVSTQSATVKGFLLSNGSVLNLALITHFKEISESQFINLQIKVPWSEGKHLDAEKQTLCTELPSSYHVVSLHYLLVL